MGLSSTEVVSNNGCSEWSQISMQEIPKPSCLNSKLHKYSNQQQRESVKCPRCDSPNTKFCYYNNYSRSQPRYFCKTCKRHWTKGGTLRSVPVGGGRKNKRLKKPPRTATTTTSTQRSSSTVTPPETGGAHKSSTTTLDDTDPRCFALRHPSSVFNFQYDDSTSTSQNPNPCQVSDTKMSGSLLELSQSSSYFNYVTGEVDDPGIEGSIVSQAWELSTTKNGVEHWNWDDIDNFVSASDLNISWDDPADIKP